MYKFDKIINFSNNKENFDYIIIKKYSNYW